MLYPTDIIWVSVNLQLRSKGTIAKLKEFDQQEIIVTFLQSSWKKARITAVESEYGGFKGPWKLWTSAVQSLLSHQGKPHIFPAALTGSPCMRSSSTHPTYLGQSQFSIPLNGMSTGIPSSHFWTWFSFWTLLSQMFTYCNAVLFWSNCKTIWQWCWCWHWMALLRTESLPQTQFPEDVPGVKQCCFGTRSRWGKASSRHVSKKQQGFSTGFVSTICGHLKLP